MSEYFPHDYDARADEKIMHLISELGYEGYGVFWAIIETMYQNKDDLQLDYKRIAFALNTSTDIVESVVTKFGLFEIENNVFWSNSVLERKEKRALISKKRSDAARVKWDKDANALQVESKSNAIKEKKRKEKKKNIEGVKEKYLQMKTETTDITYSAFIDFLLGNNPGTEPLDTCLSFNRPFITEQKFNELINEFGKQKVKEKLEAINNEIGITGKRKLLSSTLKAWCGYKK